jgi:hypothetical protein
MEKGKANKMVKKSEDKEISKEKIALNEYIFPTYKIIIYASSIEEANKQLESLLQADKVKK